MKNLQGLVSFIEAAQAGSFTAAAQRLDLTPAAVSKNVARLEGELQVRLFQRTTRRLTLTPEGEVFLASASPALAGLDAAVGAITQRSEEPVGRVRISVGIAFGRRFVLPLLPQLLATHPRLELELSLDNRPVDLVAEGFDIGVRGGILRDASWVARRVCKLPLVLVASPEYLARHGVPATPLALARHQLLGVRFANGKQASWHFRKPGGRGQQAIEPAARLWCSDPEALVDLALAGEGICQSALHHVLGHLASGRLQRVLADVHLTDELEVVLHYPHRRFLSPRVRVVVDALLAHLRAQPDLHAQPGALPAHFNAALPRAQPAGEGRGRPAAAQPTRRRKTSRSRVETAASKA